MLLGSAQPKEVPFLNEYAKTKDVLEKTYIITRVIVCDTGLLVCVDDFNAFIFEGTDLCSELLNFLARASASFEDEKIMSDTIMLRVDNMTGSKFSILTENAVESRYCSGFSRKGKLIYDVQTFDLATDEIITGEFDINACGSRTGKKKK